MNHQIGDIVTVVDYDTILLRTKGNSNVIGRFDETSAYFTEHMRIYCNQTYKIVKTNIYGYEFEKIDYTFSDYMLTSFGITQPYEYW